MRSQLLRSYSYLYNKASTKDQEQLCVDMLFLVPTTSTGRAFYMLSGLAYPPLLACESCGYVRKILNACDNIRSVANKRTTCWKPAAPVRRFLHPSQSRSPNHTKATKNMVRELRPCTSLSLSRGHLDTCVDAWARGQAVVELVEERGLGRAMLACCSSRFLSPRGSHGPF